MRYFLYLAWHVLLPTTRARVSFFFLLAVLLFLAAGLAFSPASFSSPKPYLFLC